LFWIAPLIGGAGGGFVYRLFFSERAASEIEIREIPQRGRSRAA
jgi:hypothetical protein